MTNRDKLIEMGYEDAIVYEFPDYDDAIIGVTYDGRVVYDFDKMVSCLMKQDGMSATDAEEFIDYNSVYVPDGGPVIMYNLLEFE